MNKNIKSKIILSPISHLQNNIVIKLDPLEFLGCFEDTSDVKYAIEVLEERLQGMGWNANINSKTWQAITGETFSSELSYVAQVVQLEIEKVHGIVKAEIAKRLDK